MSFTSCIPIPLISPYPWYPPSTLAAFPTTEKKFHCGYTTLCPTVYPFVHTSLLAVVHCNNLLVRYEASGYSYEYWNLIGTPLRHPSNFGSVGSAPSCTPAVYWWGRCWSGPIQNSGIGPAGQPVAFPALTPSGSISVSMVAGPVLLCCPGKVQTCSSESSSQQEATAPPFEGIFSTEAQSSPMALTCVTLT